MPTTTVLTLGPGNTFSRSKLQTMPNYQKQNINNLLDKIEKIYQKLLPGNSKLIWMIYFSLLCLFLLSGVIKNIRHGEESSISKIAKQKTTTSQGQVRLLQQQASPDINQIPSYSPNSPESGTPMAASDMNMRQDEIPTTEKDYESTLSRLEPDFIHDLKRGVYVFLEVFFICFPFYYLLSRYRKQKLVLGLVKDLIDIENRQLITNYQVKVEISELSVLTLVQFDTDGYQTDLDISTMKLVTEKRSLSKKIGTRISAPVMSI